jgi:hypothetical protein
MKPLHVALSELGREIAARFAFEYFSRVRRVSLLSIIFFYPDRAGRLGSRMSHPLWRCQAYRRRY